LAWGRFELLRRFELFKVRAYRFELLIFSSNRFSSNRNRFELLRFELFQNAAPVRLSQRFELLGLKLEPG